APPSGTLLSMQTTQPVSSVVSSNPFSNQGGNPLSGQTGMSAFVTNLKQRGMDVKSQVSTKDPSRNKITATPKMELASASGEEKEILGKINPDISEKQVLTLENKLGILGISVGILSLLFRR